MNEDALNRPDTPRPEAPMRKLPNFRQGFNETVTWKPGFDDPDMMEAGGTPGLRLEVRVRYARPSAYPSEVYITPAPPHGGSDTALATQCEETGTFISLLLRHGWTPAQLVEHTKRGGLGRAVALYLTRCHLVIWQEPSR